MTILEETQNPEAEPEVVEEIEYIPKYHIDPSRTAELNRSLSAILLSRRCPSCRSRIESERDVPSDQEQMKEITKCCATQEGFIRPEMPMQEIIFRTLLSERNLPIGLDRLHYLVTDQWYTPVNPRNISMSGLARVLNSDSYYGFAEVPPDPVKK